VAEVPAELVLATARALMMAARWELAGHLLDTSNPGSPAERALLALGRAEAAVQLRQWRGTGDPAAPLADAASQMANAGREAAADLELLRLFADYWEQLLPADGSNTGFGPAGRDPAALAELTRRAQRLLTTAPGPRQAAQAAFLGGLVAENLCGEHARGEELFSQALARCEPGRDDDIASEALRHLGGVAQDAGDLPLARERWERSAELAERAGWVTLALAQQILLAELAAQESNPQAATTLATEARRWTAALALPRHESDAAAIMADDH
jgi:hypothetical protein